MSDRRRRMRGDLMVKYVVIPAEHDGPEPSVFLAGGITACPDWQAEAADLFRDLYPAPLVLFSPRHGNFDWEDPEASRKQVTWEYEKLHRATVTMFWFPACRREETVQPIALFELGAAAADSGRLIAVGADPRYPRVDDVRLQLGLSRPNLPVRDTLEAVVSDTVGLLRALAP